MIDHVAVRDRLCRRYYDRPGTVEQIAAEEFPGIDPADVEAVRRHVFSQCMPGGVSLSLVRVREDLDRAAEWNHKAPSPCCGRESRRIGFRVRQCRKCKRIYEILEHV